MRAREGLSRVPTSFGGAVGVRTVVSCRVGAICAASASSYPLFTPVTHHHHTSVKKVGETSFSSGGGGVYRLAGSRKSPRWTLLLRQPSCLAGSSDPQRRSRPRAVEDELRSCWSTEVHTAARTPHPPTTQPPHDARAFSTDRARAAPPQGRSRSRTGRAGTAARPPSAKSSIADAARDRCSDVAGLPAPIRTEYDDCERMRMREQSNVSVDRVLVCSSRYIAKRCQS